MIEYYKVYVKSSDSQLNKLKSAAKNQTGVALRRNIKMFNGNNLPHELLIRTRQKAKLKNALENNMSTDIKLSKAQITKIFQFGWFLGSLLGNVVAVAVPLAKNILAPLEIAAPLQQLMQELQKKTWTWNNNFNNFKGRNEWHNETFSRSWVF